MKTYSTYAQVVNLLGLILVMLTGCTRNRIDNPITPEENVASWVRIDSMLGTKEQYGQSVYTDGQQLIFSTPNALYTYPANGSATQSFRFDKEAYTRPVYYKGVAYLIQSETQIKCIPYTTNEAPFYISLKDLGTLNSTRTQFSINRGIFDALAINDKGQLLVLANDRNAPESLYQIQLDNRGRPVWDSARKSYQVTLPDSVRLSVIRPYSVGDGFYIHSDYKLLGITDKAMASDLTLNKDWSVNYVF